MSDFFDKLADSIAKGVNFVVDKTEGAVNVVGAKVDRVKLENQKRAKVEELGKRFYEMSQANSLGLEELRELCAQVAEMDKLIEAKLQEEAQAKSKL